MEATDKVPKELKSRIEHFYKHFLEVHNTRSIREKMPKMLNNYETIGYILNIFNSKISWITTDYGYSYYYALNMRWVIGISYLCHELYPSFDEICIRFLKKFVDYYSSCPDKDKYERTKRIYSLRVKKIEKIFGN